MRDESRSPDLLTFQPADPRTFHRSVHRKRKSDIPLKTPTLYLLDYSPHVEPRDGRERATALNKITEQNEKSAREKASELAKVELETAAAGEKAKETAAVEHAIAELQPGDERDESRAPTG